jgi:RNA polymerase sigma-70 factor, ECF subfamily
VDDAVFKAQLVALIPHLRAFGHSLAGQMQGEDLAQDAMLKAWTSRHTYQQGSNMKAWAFTILRNVFLSERRRAWRSVALDPAIAEKTLVANDDPHAAEDLLDVHNAMQLLPLGQREALILAGPAGLSYEETAEICGCAVGTVKSRINRGREALSVILGEQRIGKRMKTDISAGIVLETLVAEANLLKERLRKAR